MRFALIFGVTGAVLIQSAWAVGGVAWLALWPGLNFLALAAIYGANRPAWLGKRPDGRMALTRIVAMAPYFLFTWSIWHLFRRVTREPPCHEVAPNIFLGRRPLRSDLPPSVTFIVDLTAEFPRNRSAAGDRLVHQLPTLDAHAPTPKELASVVEEAAASPGPIYIHCAAGHGRSALVAALVLVRRGLAATVDDAMAMMARSRPAVRLHPAQRQAALDWFATRAGGEHSNI